MDRPKAYIEIPDGQRNAAEFRIVLRVVNESDRPTELLNPDVGRPDPVLKWPYSIEAYRLALLISFHLLSISVTDHTGQRVPQQLIATWSTPGLKPNLVLAPGESTELPVPLGEFYELKWGKTYDVEIEYGREDGVAARAWVPVS